MLESPMSAKGEVKALACHSVLEAQQLIHRPRSACSFSELGIVSTYFKLYWKELI